MKTILGTMLALCLCLCWVQPLPAGYSDSKKELKASVCAMPVLACEQMKYDVLQSVELGDECPEGSFTHKQCSLPVMILEKRCFRISRGKSFGKLEVRTKSLRDLTINLKEDPKSVFRSIPLIC